MVKRLMKTIIKLLIKKIINQKESKKKNYDNIFSWWFYLYGDWGFD